MDQCRQTLREYISGVPRRWSHRKPDPPLRRRRSHAPHEKGGITAGQRGGLDEDGSRSLPRQEKGQDEQPKTAAKERCYLQLCVELRGFEPLTPSMRTLATPVDSGHCRKSADEDRRVRMVAGVLVAARVAARGHLARLRCASV